MRAIILFFSVLFLFALPAKAVTLIVDNGDVFAIGPADVYDHVIMFETADISMSGGSVVGHFLMLDQTTATFTGGTVGSLDVFGEANATVVIQPGSLAVDGLPTPEPTTLTSVECPSCTLSAILANGDPVGPTPAAALQSGQIGIVAVPEPVTASLMLFGLLSLAWAGTRRAA